MSERRPKKRPNVFAQVVANADEVVQASFIASGPTAGQVAGATAAAVSAPPTTEQAAPAAVDQTAPPATEAFKAPHADGTEVSGPATLVSKPAADPVPTSSVPASPKAPQESEAAHRHVKYDAVAYPRAALTPRAVAAAEPSSAQSSVLAEEETAPAAPEVDRSQSAGEPAVLLASEPEAATKVASRRRPVVARRGGQHHWAHQAVFESFASATIESKNWRLHGFRIVPDVLAQLKTRINADRRSTGNVKLAISHYIDAALRHASTDVEEQVALAQEFLTARMGMVEAGRQSTYRVGPQASAWVADLNVGLQEADYGRKGIYVVSASIESFIGALDGAGSLLRPEIPGAR